MGVADGLFSQMAAVGLVLLLLAGTLLLLRRKGTAGISRIFRGGEEQSGVRLLGGRNLTSQHAVFAVEAESTRFLVATFPGGATVQKLDGCFPQTFAESLERNNGTNHA